MVALQDDSKPLEVRWMLQGERTMDATVSKYLDSWLTRKIEDIYRKGGRALAPQPVTIEGNKENLEWELLLSYP